MRITFASIADSDKVAYQYDSDAYSRNPLVNSEFRLYETLGDGMIAHTPSMDIAPERLTDYLQSALRFMFAEDQTKESTLTYQMSIASRRGPCDEVIAFAASIVAKDSDKDYSTRRYYSISERKISKKAELQYDKRYQEVPTWADGSSESIYRLLKADWHDGFTAYMYAYNVREWCINHSVWCDSPGALMGWFREEHEKDMNLMYAVRAVGSVLIWLRRFCFVAVFAVVVCWPAIFPTSHTFIFPAIGRFNLRPHSPKTSPQTKYPFAPEYVGKFDLSHAVHGFFAFTNGKNLLFVSRTVFGHHHHAEGNWGGIRPDNWFQMQPPKPFWKRIEKPNRSYTGVHLSVCNESLSAAINQNRPTYVISPIFILNEFETIQLNSQLGSFFLNHQIALLFRQIGLLLDSFEGPISQPNTGYSYAEKNEASNPGCVIEPITLHRHGDEFGDRYGLVSVFSMYAFCGGFWWIALGRIWSGNRKSGWALLLLGTLIGLCGAMSGAIGCLPWNWGKCLSDGQEHSEYRQTFQHNPAIVPHKYLDSL